MNVLLFAYLNPAGTTVDHIFMKGGFRMVVKNWHNLFIIDACDGLFSTNILQEGLKLTWTSDYMHMHLIMCRDGATVKQAEETKLSEVHALSALTKYDSPFMNRRKVLVNLKD